MLIGIFHICWFYKIIIYIEIQISQITLAKKENKKQTRIALVFYLFYIIS